MGKKIKAATISSIVVSVSIGAVLGWLVRKQYEIKPVVPIRENPTDYKFISPILFLQSNEDTAPQSQVLKKIITKYIDTAEQEKKVTDASVYFRKLNTDQWLGVNQDDLYAPASMLKVLSLIAFLHNAQNNPSLYLTQVRIAPHMVNTDTNQDFYPPADPVTPGEEYSANELLSHMIIYSDNNAANAINALIGAPALEKVFTDLKIPSLSQNTPTDFISPKMYSRAFRALYNGGYISNTVSNQSLELLSKTTFTKGLVAGVPSGTIVSHKFGERSIGTGATSVRELHDCGIIYAPNNPYLLCVMTKGTAFPDLEKVIADISGITWQSVKDNK